VIRGERLIKPEDSWFLAKFIKVNNIFFFKGGRVSENFGGVITLLVLLRLANFFKITNIERVFRREG